VQCWFKARAGSEPTESGLVGHLKHGDMLSRSPGDSVRSSLHVDP
jgi:hypothetical protein